MEILICCFSSQNLNAQLFFKTQDYQLKVENESKQVFRFPWAGGMNSCQFGEIDMNMDGISDLFVFDRHGNRIMTFINNGTAGITDYDYAPEYIRFFPELKEWVIIADYNYDGKPDIFTMADGLPGIIVYRNISAAEPEFTLEVYPYLTSFQGGGNVNILVTNVDYPGISDIDNDGDLDILTFWGLGSFVDMHKNLSMEKYGIPDSLDYIKTSSCWGYFAENDESNDIYFDTCIGQFLPVLSKTRHTGSTFLLIDIDQDEDKDLLLGDVDYPNLIQLINGGTPDSAYMISADTLFPSYNKPVNLFSMPAAAYIDVNNDGVKDLILSPFDPGLTTSQNQQSVYLYFNEGGNELPDFRFETKNFLQGDMIDVGSGAYPALADYDGDGLQDLFISNFGNYIYSSYGPGNTLQSVYWSNVSLFINTGTQSQPMFTRTTHNFGNLEDYQLTGIFLSFGDIDGDGDQDMLLGHKEGNLWLFENISGLGQPMSFNQPIVSYQDIDIGAYSAPQLFDLNADGLLDLIIGEEGGNLNYYRNTGSASDPVFDFVTDSLGKVNVTDYQLSYSGFSTPCFFRNNLSVTQLVVGSETGKLFYYRNIDGNLDGVFEESDSLFAIINNQPFEIHDGIRAAAVIKDLNNDGFPDLVTGNYSGGLNYYSGTGIPPVNAMDEHVNTETEVTLYPNPSNDVVHVDIRTKMAWVQVEISIYNMLSERILTRLFDSGDPLIINVSSLPSGLYLCEVKLPAQLGIHYRQMLITR